MDDETRMLVRGGIELAADAFEAAVGAAADTQSAIVRQVYAPFALLGPLAVPVLAIEQIQSAITAQVYQAVLGGGMLIARGAAELLADDSGK